MNDLATLLRERLRVIADAELRENDPDAHLKALQRVSEAIGARHQELRDELPARLNHFLSHCSYDKALAFIEDMPAS